MSDPPDPPPVTQQHQEASPPAPDASTTQPSAPVPAAVETTTRPSRIGKLLGQLLGEALAPLIFSVAAIAWLHLQELPSVLVWVIAVLAILLTYFILLGVQYFFPRDLRIEHTPRIHFIFVSLFIVMVTAPLATLQMLNRAQANQLNATTEAGEAKQLLLYEQVSESLRVILPKPSLDTGDFHNLFNICIHSIHLSNHDAARLDNLRTAVFYVYEDKTGQDLRIPDHGYDGYLGPGIQDLHFRLTPEKRETPEERCKRLGIAGWCIANDTDKLFTNIEKIKAGDGPCYKPFPSPISAPDRAMICVRIPDLQRPDHSIGILAVSSPTEGLLTPNDQAIMSAVATLFGRFTTPLPPARESRPTPGRQ